MFVSTPPTAGAPAVQSDDGTPLGVERAKCQATLDALLERSAGFRFASLSTVDGRSFAFAANSQEDKSDEQKSAPRFAAITSSLLALSESFAREALEAKCYYTAVSTDHGSLVTVRAPNRKRTYALSVCADPTENMAMTLRLTIDCAESLARIVDRLD